MEHARPQAADQARPQDDRSKTSVPRRSHALRQAAFWRAWTIWALTAGATAAGFIFNRSHPAIASAGSQGNPANALAAVMFIGGFGTVGALLAWKRSANPTGLPRSAAPLRSIPGPAVVPQSQAVSRLPLRSVRR